MKQSPPEAAADEERRAGADAALHGSLAPRREPDGPIEREPGAGAARSRLRSALRSVFDDRGVRAALFAFALTRLLVLLVFVLVGQTKISFDDTNRVFISELNLKKVPIARILREEVLTADANWYVGIARDGYERRAFDADKPHNWAFFPLYPLLLRAAAFVTGEYALTGMLLSHLFFLLALIFLYRVAEGFGLGAEDAGRCVFYVAAFPVSYFFSLPLTESLFLFLTIGSVYFAGRERWWTAALFGALAAATRTTGVLLMPTLVLLYWQTYRRLWPPRATLFSPALVPVGLLSFMVYLHFLTGNAFAFKDAMRAWGRKTGLFLLPLYEFVRHPFEIATSWDFRFLNFWAAIIVLTCGVLLVKQRRFALGFYTLASTLVALSSVLLQSQARYAMVVFPAFMVLAVAGRRPYVDQLIRAVSLVLLSLMAAMFAADFSIALS
ncbi:MAG TPA: mannosyltransferase family protein [Pyrinomonadaceae bacterium]|jgi:hypothetical protein|nr:mannosyltransferase family protein [Pyrinomonadaceae bacterium]